MTKFKAQIAQIKQLLSVPVKVAITTHKSPDGDALGSMLGLALYLQNEGHEVECLSVNEYADFLAWLPQVETITINDLDPERVASIVANADVIFCLDYNALSRVEQIGPHIDRANGSKVMVDHHLNPQDFVDIMISDASVGSTAELIYELLVELSGKSAINVEISKCLYTGIVTDTGSFRFPSTRSETHEIVAHMLSLGLSQSEIHDAVYDTYSHDRLKLVGYALSQKMTYLRELNAVVMVLDAQELARFKHKKGDTEGLVNMGLSIMGVRFAALITESEGLVKMSLRSKGNMPVNELAGAHFNGGGHKNAAGGRSDVSPEQTKDQLLTALEAYKSYLVE